MKPRTTLILVAIFLALFAYVYFVEIRRPEPPPKDATPTPGPLWSVKSEQVVGLTIKSDSRETRLSRPTDGEWRLEAPVADAADDMRVSRIVGLLVDVRPTRTLTDTTSLEEFGLSRPAMEVTLRLADGRAETLQIGAQNPQGTAHFALVQGQTGIHLIASYLVTSLQELLDTPPSKPTPTPTSTPAPTATPSATPAG